MSVAFRETGVPAIAAEYVREQIRQGQIAPGERIVERTIADQLGISSIAVRDAFARLTLEGWIERIPRRGVRVRTLDVDEIVDISDLRALLEGEAAARAATQFADAASLAPVSVAALELISSIPGAMTRAGKRGDRQALLALDDAFHAALWHLAASPTLEEILQNLRARITPMIRESVHLIARNELVEMGNWHAELLAALHEGSEPARLAAAHHTNRTKQRVLEHSRAER